MLGNGCETQPVCPQGSILSLGQQHEADARGERPLPAPAAAIRLMKMCACVWERRGSLSLKVRAPFKRRERMEEEGQKGRWNGVSKRPVGLFT